MLYKSPLNVQLVIHVSDVQREHSSLVISTRHPSLTTERRYTVGSVYLPESQPSGYRCNATPVPNAEIISFSPALLHDELSLKDWAGGLCALVPAASDRKTSADQLFLDHLPSANLLVLVDWCLPGFVGGNVAQFPQLLELLCLGELSGLGPELDGREEVVHG